MSVDEFPAYPFPAAGPLEPPVELARLRRSEPVSRVRLPSGDAGWLVADYEGVRSVLTGPRFSRRLDRPDAARLTAPGGFYEFERNPAGADLNDPPGHTRWRRLVSAALTPARVQQLRAPVEAIVRDLLQSGMRHGPPLDLIGSLATPLPIRAISELLGVPALDRGTFGGWAEALLSVGRHTREESRTAGLQMVEYLRSLIASKRSALGDDFLSDLIRARDEDDGRLSDGELLFTLQSLIVAGWQITATHLGKALLLLLTRPELLAELRRDLALVPQAVEETLRLLGGIAGFGLPRYATGAVEVSGATIPAGATVLAQLGSANRDEREFRDPERFDLGRHPNRHVAFGAGPHFCLGAAFARLQLNAALEAFLAIPEARLAVPVEEVRVTVGLVVRGLEALPITWSSSTP